MKEIEQIMRFFAALKRIFTSWEQITDYDISAADYLMRATDVYDLERRQREIDRGAKMPHFLYWRH